jgi:hypothetical protein
MSGNPVYQVVWEGDEHEQTARVNEYLLKVSRQEDGRYWYGVYVTRFDGNPPYFEVYVRALKIPNPSKFTMKNAKQNAKHVMKLHLAGMWPYEVGA